MKPPFYYIGKLDSVVLDYSLFTERERKILNSFRVDKRAREWMSSRIFIKNKLAGIFNIKPHEVEILNDVNRKPFVILKGKKRFYISLSHRGEFVGFSYSPFFSPYIGMDIEYIEKKDEYWIRDYFTEKEQENSFEKLIEIWSVKESILKLLGVGLSVDTRDIQIHNNSLTFSGRVKEFVKYFKIDKINYSVFKNDNYITAVSWAEV